MLKELSKGKQGLASKDMQYWGLLIAIYTGARRNEIASLTPDDIKKDGKTDIWYFEFNDEEESKRLKTDAAKRVVPVHSALIDLGILAYADRVRDMAQTKTARGGQPLRLLYSLTYNDKEGWGRSLGRWVNDTFLPKMGLKDKMHTLHSLRHSFINYLSIAGVEGAYIKAMAGHEADTVTTKVYTHYNIEYLAQYYT